MNADCDTHSQAGNAADQLTTEVSRRTTRSTFHPHRTSGAIYWRRRIRVVSSTVNTYRIVCRKDLFTPPHGHTVSGMWAELAEDARRSCNRTTTTDQIQIHHSCILYSLFR